MSMSNRVSRRVKQALDQYGYDVTLKHYNLAETSHGDKREKIGEEETKILSERNVGSTSLSELFGEFVDADMVYYLPAEHPDLKGGGDETASRIEDTGDTYVVLEVDRTTAPGLLIIDAEKEVES